MKNYIFSYLNRILNKISITRHRRKIYNAVKNGLTLGKNVTIMDDVRFDPPHNRLIRIDDNTTICPEVAFIAHDASTFKVLGYSRLGYIHVKENCFIGERVTILPGVIIGKNCIIAAGSVVTKDIPDFSIAAGNPAVVIRSYQEYLNKRILQIEKSEVYSYSEFYKSIGKYIKLTNEGFKDDMKLFFTKGQTNAVRSKYRFNL